MSNWWLKSARSILVALLVLTPVSVLSQTPAPTESAAEAHAISSVAYDATTTTVELMESAREMFIADRYDLAEMLYKSVLTREPKNVEAMQELAIIYEATGQLQYARGLLSRALIERPSDPEIIRFNAHILRKLSMVLQADIDSLMQIEAYEQAIPKLAILLTTQPENADLYFKKANCHLHLNNPEAALVEIEHAQEITREQRFDDLKSTAKAAKQKAEIDRMTSQARRALNDKTTAGREKALEVIGRILDIDPSNAWAKAAFARQTDGGHEATDLSTRLTAWWSLLKKNLAGTGDQVVSVSVLFRDHMDVLLTILLALLIFTSPLTHFLVRGFSTSQALCGRLEHFRLQELLALINTHRRTGVLILRTPKARGKIYFDKGEVYHCKSGRASGRAAVQNLLKTTSKGYFVFKNAVVSKEDTIDTPLSLILLGLPERAVNVTSESILQKQKQQSRMKSLLSRKD